MNALFLYNIAAHLWQEEFQYLSLGQSLKFTKNSLNLKEYCIKYVTKDNFMEDKIVGQGINVILNDFKDSEYDSYDDPELSGGIYSGKDLYLNDYREYIIATLVIRKNTKELGELLSGSDKNIEIMLEGIDRKLSYHLDKSVPKIKEEDLFKIRKMISDAIEYRVIYENVAIGDEVIIDLMNRDFRTGECNYICPNCGTNEIKESHEYCCMCGKKIHWNKEMVVKDKDNYFQDEFL